jgi:hypothetical protein
MKKFLFLITMFSLASMSFRPFNTGRIEGSVFGSEKAIEAATISVLKAKDSSLAKMALTTKTGQFEVERIAEGRYLIMVSAVGYKKYYSETFELSEGTPSYKLKDIVLSVADKSLKEVTVTAKKQFVEQKMDRTLINVDASPTNAGLTAMDVLEKSPGISVDKDGNISLKGKAGVMVMVDGKPTYLSAQDLANMLKNMSSNKLEQIGS